MLCLVGECLQPFESLPKPIAESFNGAIEFPSPTFQRRSIPPGVLRGQLAFCHYCQFYRFCMAFTVCIIRREVRVLLDVAPK